MTMRQTHITINQSALAHNLGVFKRQLSTNTRIMAMVKANAYGHGVPLCVAGLLQADAFGVATFDEGLEVQHTCQHLNTHKDVVLIEGVFSADEWLGAIKHGFGCVVHCNKQLDWAIKNTPPTDSFSNTIWLKYNTGMNRLGFDQANALKSAKILINAGYRIVLTSHFACADDKNHPSNAMQIKHFHDTLSALKSQYGDKIQGSLCNSAGIMNFAHAHYDWVRAGIGLYGGTPMTDKSASELGLQAVMTFSSQIFATHHLCAGEQVGYGGLWVADKPSRIGVLAVGYGDGYPRVVVGAKVLIIKNQQTYFVPVVGRVAMDMMMIDITGLPIDIGDTVILWGDGLACDEVAAWANTIGYELFCKTTKRPNRRFVL